MPSIKLYPPIIPETLSAFYKGNFNNGTVTRIAVPFSMNKAVNTSEIWGFALKIKTIQSNKVLFNDQAEIKIQHFSGDTEYFSLLDKFFTDNNIKIGQFLKIQLAYISKDENDEKGEIGYYSNVGIIKYTSEPNIYIKEFKDNPSNNTYSFISTLTGVYELGEDSTEKPYQYQFSISSENNICETSGWLMHDNTNEIDEFVDTYTFKTTIDPDKIYNIKYEVKTINNLEKSVSYNCEEEIQEIEIIPFEIEVKNVFDEGYVDISFNNVSYYSSFQTLYDELQQKYGFYNGISWGESDTSPATHYKIFKNSEEDDSYIEIKRSSQDPSLGTIFLITYVQVPDKEDGLKQKVLIYTSNPFANNITFELHRVNILSNQKDILIKTFTFSSPDEISNKNFKDFTIEQGKTYQYYFRQKNLNNTYSQNFYSKVIIADFEDMFLWDGQKQLKIRFNPKISSFKINLLEQKIDTIGSQYPFIFKSGKVKYAEFPISGLISYHIDENKLFFDNSMMGYEEYFNGINLTGDNIYFERNFKMQVLEWLNDGKLKLFKSPAEGNFLVKLMNVSLSPEDRLNRMLHSFSTTAYECEDCSYENLLKYSFISVEED